MTGSAIAFPRGAAKRTSRRLDGAGPTRLKHSGGVGHPGDPAPTPSARREYLGYDKLACAGGDSYACFAYHVAANDNFAGNVATDRLVDALKAANDDYSSSTLNTIRLDLAEAYATYLPQSPASAAWPTTMDISQLHWNVLEQFGLPPSTFGGTPLGTMFAPITAPLTGKYIWPQWCGNVCKR